MIFTMHWKYFCISFIIGLLGVYLQKPQPRIVFMFPEENQKYCQSENDCTFYKKQIVGGRHTHTYRKQKPYPLINIYSQRLHTSHNHQQPTSIIESTPTLTRDQSHKTNLDTRQATIYPEIY